MVLLIVYRGGRLWHFLTVKPDIDTIRVKDTFCKLLVVLGTIGVCLSSDVRRETVRETNTSLEVVTSLTLLTTVLDTSRSLFISLELNLPLVPVTWLPSSGFTDRQTKGTEEEVTVSRTRAIVNIEGPTDYFSVMDIDSPRDLVVGFDSLISTLPKELD